jgi:endoglucanase
MCVRATFSIAFFSLTAGIVLCQTPQDRIRLNQIGFYPAGPKLAIVVDAEEGPFYVTTPDQADTLYTGQLSSERTWFAAAAPVRGADFSLFRAPGEYVVVVPSLGSSHTFRIDSDVHGDVSRASMKAFYYQRASMALEEAFAGKWKRNEGHPDTAVYVHPSAATSLRPRGTLISAPRGWYDAGDYNKYVVNSGITVGTLLSLYEDFPAHLDTLDLNIPETGNGLPDILDEILWNVRWMLAMQDPDDGGVYHKLTTPYFEPFVMPENATTVRFVVMESTAAALDFAAVTAQSARVFGAFDDDVPGLADSCLAAALEAWRWARQNPKVPYVQSAINVAFDPDITTGEYADSDFRDEFVWAATELYATTRQDSFLTAVNLSYAGYAGVPTWASVGTLAFYTLIRLRDELQGIGADAAEVAKSMIERLAENRSAGAESTAYRIVMGKSGSDFPWGSNSGAANQAIALIYGYRLTGERRYLELALANLDYLLGRNATSYSFVTGQGDKTPRFPHHRQSEADGVSDPVPGLLVGGPTAGPQDGCNYPSNFLAESYSDEVCSYTTNEIAINWNAAFAYLVTAIEALEDEGAFTPVGIESAGVLHGDALGIQSVYPNPFRDRTIVSFVVDRPQRVLVTLTDLLGRRLGDLMEIDAREGRNEVAFSGLPIAPGVYFVSISGSNFSSSAKIVQAH